MKITLSILFLLISFLTFAQPSTEIYLLDLSFVNKNYEVSNPVSISLDNPGYDNQPSFSPDGQFLYYVATRNSQTDIVAVNILADSRNWVNNTPDGGEYSPNLSPDKKFISAVQLETSGRQLLWKYKQNDLQESEILIEEAKIGYYSWVNTHKLLAFVLGEPSTLQFFDLKNNTSEIITENIGRSINKIPGSNKISYISKMEKEWKIYAFNPRNKKSKLITCSLTSSEDMAWTKEKYILMGKGGKLYAKHPKKDSKWKEISSFNKLHFGNPTRLAVSPDGKKLAVVVDTK